SDYTFDPKTGTVFASFANGGVWMSTDHGVSWKSIGDQLPTQIVGALVWTPAAGGRLVVLSGDNAFGGYTYGGAGIYYTNDLGRTWTKAQGAPDGAQG